MKVVESYSSGRAIGRKVRVGWARVRVRVEMRSAPTASKLLTKHLCYNPNARQPTHTLLMEDTESQS